MDRRAAVGKPRFGLILDWWLATDLILNCRRLSELLDICVTMRH